MAGGAKRWGEFMLEASRYVADREGCEVSWSGTLMRNPMARKLKDDVDL
jgi:hypothetical protein